MAKASIDAAALDGLCAKINKLPGHSEEITKKALYKGAGILTDRVHDKLQGVLSGTSSGELLASLGIAPMRYQGGVANASVGFDGYDSKGVPNQLKARAMESGTSKQKKRPFMRPALNETKGLVQDAMLQVMEEEINKLL